MLKRIITYLFVFSAAIAAHGQDLISSAYESFQKGELERARLYIDSASVDAALMKDAQVWYVRGFIYKELYKQKEKGNPVSPAREEALSSFIKSIKLDSTEENIQNNKENINYIATSYYNDVVAHLTLESYKTSIVNYQKFNELMKLYNPLVDLKSRDREYKLAMASLHTKLYNADNKNEEYFNNARILYEEILSSDPENMSANYNLGILHYNKAVNIINALDYDMDMVALMEIQDKCVEIFKQSLPYMEKAYSLNPKRKETLIGLSGIYFSLNEFEKSNSIKAELDNLGK